MSSSSERRLTLFFIDGSSFTVSFPPQIPQDPATLAAGVRKAIEADNLTIEMDGDLFVIPVRNLKYVQVTPAPESLPSGVIRGARMVF